MCRHHQGACRLWLTFVMESDVTQWMSDCCFLITAMCHLNWIGQGEKKSASTPCYLNSNWICNPASVGRDLYVLMFCFSTYEKLFKSETLKQYIDTESDQRLHTSCIYAFKRQQKTVKVFSPRHTHPSNHLHLGAIFFCHQSIIFLGGGK